MNSSGDATLIELQRPGRHLRGPLARSFRIVSVAADVLPLPAWQAADFDACPSRCGLEASFVTRTVRCLDPDSGSEVAETRCLAAKPAVSYACGATPACGVGCYLRFTPGAPEHGPQRLTHVIPSVARSEGSDPLPDPPHHLSRSSFPAHEQ